ncbi:MAG: Serine phosphatase [candidate division Zixibacteria bacterium RBG-1]|nr:MAG: Serine phosphatase [candidate division Zixibacteria bacterium RBG-1]OGC84155.1 MAG: hypothetical protein A2V73_06990 [candidate division Zixibacteria bacterium RBG_19FT_COMBO_42_43]
MPEETAKNRLEAENLQLRQAVEELSILNEIAFAIGSQTEVDKISELIVSKCTKKIKAEQGCILLLSEDQNSPFKTYIRKIEHKTEMIPIHLGTTLMGWMIKNQKPLIINDLKNDKRFQSLDPGDFHSLLMVPLKLKNKFTGVLCLFNKDGEFSSDQDQRLLSIIAVSSAQVIENARQAEIEKKFQEMERELLVAKEIQIRLLPKEPPQVDGFDIQGYTLPTKQVGGDYFDFIELPDKNLGVAIADVSGKGMPAALLMANFQATLRNQSLAKNSPSEMVSNCNNLVCRSVEKGQFVTFFWGALNCQEKSFNYVNAGHNPPFIFNKRGEITRLTDGGLILGLLENVPFEQKKVKLNSGDLLLLFTDGITEAMNETQAQFEEERLIKVVEENRLSSADQIIKKITQEVLAFQGLQPQFDDLTLVVIKVKE